LPGGTIPCRGARDEVGPGSGGRWLGHGRVKGIAAGKFPDIGIQPAPGPTVLASGPLRSSEATQNGTQP
jgi:hypothetical protein